MVTTKAKSKISKWLALLYAWTMCVVAAGSGAGAVYQMNEENFLFVPLAVLSYFGYRVMVDFSDISDFHRDMIEMMEVLELEAGNQPAFEEPNIEDDTSR
jgi:hypothetical protein